MIRPYYIYLLVLLFGVFACVPAFSQFENILPNVLNKSYAERAPWLWAMGDTIHKSKDSTEAFARTAKIISFAQQHNDMALQLESELYAVFYLTTYFPGQKERIITALKDLVLRSADSYCREVEYKTRHVLASYYFNELQSFEEGFDEYNELYRLVQPVSFDAFPDKLGILYNIGTAYFSFGDYGNAIQYYGQNPPLLPVTRFQYWNVHAHNNIAICYQRMGQLDSADYYTNQLYEYAVKQKDSIWIGITKGNLGQSDFQRGRYEQAIAQMKVCVYEAVKAQDWNLAAGSLLPMAEIYFNQHRIADANATVLQAKAFIEKDPQYHRYAMLYALLAKMHAFAGKAELAARYIDSSVLVTDSLHRKFSSLQLVRVVQKDALLQHKARMAEIERRKDLLTLKLYALLVIAILVFVVTLFIYRNKRLKHRQEQLLKDLKLKEKEKQLAVAQEQLLDFAHHLAEKNELIQKLETQQENSTDEVMQELEQAVILTGKDWGRFRELFEQVHPGYLALLPEKIPGITPAEIRMMALAKLNFSNKEMAASLGVTPQAIRVTWHRLRKKLGLSEEGTIEELVSRII